MRRRTRACSPNFEVVLEADEVVAVGAEVFLAELDGGVGPAAGLGVGEAGGLHGAEAEGVAAAAGGLFDGEAAFEVVGAWRRCGIGDPGIRSGPGARSGSSCGSAWWGRRSGIFPGFGFDVFGGGEGVEEGVVFLLGEGAVDVVGGAFVPAGGEVDLVHVDGGGVDDGGDAVVEGEVVGAGEALEFGGEGRR